MARSRVELFEQIRRDWRAGGSSIRELAVRHQVHRRTVRQALASALPPPRKAYSPRPRPAIGRYAAIIDEWLLADREVPRKQRHTARRVWQRLVAEHGASMAEVTVSRYVARRRAELGLDKVQVMVPQAHEPGAEAEVDFGEFHAVIAVAPVDVRAAAVVLGPGVPCRVRHPGAGGVPGGPCAGVGVLRRGAGPGAGMTTSSPGVDMPVRPGPGRVRAVHRAALPLRLRLVLLHPGQGRGACGKRPGGRRNRPVHRAPGPRPRRRVAGRAEPADRRGRPGR